MRKTKRVLALALSAVVACAATPILAVVGADEEVRVTPPWFEAENYGVWWATDQADASGTSWRYTVAAGENGWTYTMHSNLYDAGFAESNAQDVVLDVDETPYLNFRVSASKATSLYINASTRNADGTFGDKVELKLADIPAGQTVERQIALQDLEGLDGLLDEEGRFAMRGTGFKTAGFGENDTFTYAYFYATSLEAAPPEDEEVRVTPSCFDADKTTSWYASDQYGGEENWRCVITVEDGVWTYRLKDKGPWDAGRVEANANLITVDTAVTPYLNVTVKSAKDTQLYIGKRVNDDWVQIPYASVKGGELTTLQVEIAAIEGIEEYLSDGKLTIDATGFTTLSFASGDTFEYHSFYATNKKLETEPPEEPEEPLPGDDVVYPSWLTEAESGNWWDWDWNYESGAAPRRFALDYPEDGSVVLTYDGSFDDIKMVGTPHRLDLEKTPYLYLDITADFPTDLRLIVEGSPQGNDGIPLLDTFEGDKKLCIDLRTVEALQPYIQGNRLTLLGFTFRQVWGVSEAGDSLTIRTFDFAGEGKTYPASRPAAPEIRLSTENRAESVDVTVSAAEGAPRVQFRIGSTGEFTEYTGPFTVTKNVPVYARYFSANGFWSMTAQREITNIALPEPDPAVIPDWFQPESKPLWYNWDWQVDSDDQNRFSLSYENDVFTATFGQTYAQSLSLNQNESEVLTINLASQNALHYKIETDMALKVYLRVLKNPEDPRTSYTSVYLGDIPAGKSSDMFYLADNSELMAASDEDFNLHIVSVEFTMSPAVGDQIVVERFLFDDENEFYEGYEDGTVTVTPITPDWFSVSTVDKWTGDGAADTDFRVFYNDDNVWQADLKTTTAVRFPASPPVQIHLERNNTLYVRMRQTAPVKLWLLVKNSEGDDQPVLLAELPAGQQAGYVDLRQVEELAALGPKLRLSGVRLEGEANSTILVDSFVLDAAGMDYIGYPDEEQEAADRQAAAEVEAAIAALGDITLEKADAVRQARAQYEALTTAQKRYVGNFTLLTQAEARLEELLLESTGGAMTAVPEEDILAYMEENPGTKAIINLTQGAVLSTELLTRARETACDLEVRIQEEETGDILYTITIFSEDIPAITQPFDTALPIGKEAAGALLGEEAVNKALGLFKAEPNMLFCWPQGNAGIRATVTWAVQDASAADLKAYWYDADEGRLAAQELTAGEGTVSLVLGEEGLYALSDEEPAQGEGGSEPDDTPDTGVPLPWLVGLAAVSSLAVLGGLAVRKARSK